MRLYVAGINHNDPLCRPLLKAWLAEVAALEGDRPAFVAVEFAEPFYREVVSQRPRLRELVQCQCPSASAAFLDTVAASLLYDADTHTEVFLNASVLWLDVVEPRKVLKEVNGERTIVIETDGGASTYAEERAKIYEEALRGQGGVTEQELLARLSRRAWDGSTQSNPSRDRRFAGLIAQRVREGGEWAVAVVGALHASEAPDSMVCLLRDAHVVCLPTILRP